jgi:glucosamine-6-phosphate deaminase
MRVIVLPDYESVSRAAARLVAEAVARQPALVLGLAAGETQLGLYRELVRRQREGSLDLSRVTTFNLDEYLGLPEDHEASFRRFTRRHLLEPVGHPPGQAHAPASRPSDRDAECRRYERAIAEAGGIDLLLLGIGANGHIAFNEPGAPLDSRTRAVSLSRETVAEMRRRGVFGPGERTPSEAITIGIATILEARRLLLMACGAAKAAAVAAALEGEVTPALPASALQLHADATVLLDAAAASRLRRAPERVAS